SAARAFVVEHSWVCSRSGRPDCGSAPERSLMASDPELPRFAGPSYHWPKGGQSRIGRPERAACKSAPWQHLRLEVLHFVCELRGSITQGRCWARAGDPESSPNYSL